MANLYIPEKVNIFAGDDDPGASKHLQIQGVTLPTLEEKTASHAAGGAIGEIEIGGLGLSALTLGFSLGGYDPQTMAQFGLGGATVRPYTIFGTIRDKAAGDLIKLKAVAWGRLTKLEKSEFKQGDLATQTHEIKEIIRYHVLWGDKEMYAYDWAASIWRVNGVDHFARQRAILGI